MCNCLSLNTDFKLSGHGLRETWNLSKWPRRGEGLSLVDILCVREPIFPFFTFITIHQKVFVSSIIRNQEGQTLERAIERAKIRKVG